ncbi:hypothetical protein AB833_09850 [Chromatiales bacterium (ex Bugula neritina AB1)]|nr:hypothetical protein AB833_09850 [Chromatiales bacterium (ex Bugula neritina AB1)]
MSSVIFLHGTSSSGKSTIAKSLQTQLDLPFWHFSSDKMIESDMLPQRSNDNSAFDWKINRPLFFNAFHGCITAILDTGNNMILDHIIESHEWYLDLQLSLSKHDVFFTAIHCPISVLREREIYREDRYIGNRYIGEAEYHLQHVHTYSKYDFEIDSSKQPVEMTAGLIIDAWINRERSVFF